MRVRLTEKAVERITLPAGKEREEVHDEYLPGLVLRVGRNSKSWSLIYRVAGAGARGALSRMTLGRYPVLDLKAARDKAREALEAADRGIDPAAQRAAELETRQTRTFDAIFERFVELHVKQNTKEGRFAKERAAALAAEQEGKVKLKGPKSKPGRVAAERIIAENALPLWRDRLIETITRAEVHDLLDDIVTNKGEPLARELRKHLTKMFNWAADRGHLTASPLAGMRRPELGYVSRERVLTMDELRRVWDAAGEAGYPFGTMVRLLILTGQRRAEIAELERSWIDNEHRAVEIPASRYKTKRPHVFPLSAPAWALVQSLPKWNGGECVFTTTSGARPVSGFSKAKARLDELVNKAGAKKGLAPLPAWTVHDIRRSVATHMARLGIAQEHIERVLGHVVQGVAGTYNRYSYLDEKRAALELWGKQWS
jgi:integrase